MKISEIFYSIQGEGMLAGTPSVFVRSSGCNLRCAWCDTPYASWQPEGEELALEEILARVARYRAHYVVVTGGEPMIAPGAPAMISTGLNSADLAYVYLSIDPPGAPLVASVWEDPRLTRSVWIDLRPAEALELATRLRICAEAAAQFAEACAAGPDEAEDEDDQAVDP